MAAYAFALELVDILQNDVSWETDTTYYFPPQTVGQLLEAMDTFFEQLQTNEDELTFRVTRSVTKTFICARDLLSSPARVFSRNHKETMYMYIMIMAILTPCYYLSYVQHTSASEDDPATVFSGKRLTKLFTSSKKTKRGIERVFAQYPFFIRNYKREIDLLLNLRRRTRDSG